MRVVSSLPCLVLAGAITISLAGCSLSSTAGPTADAGVAFQGRVQGGNLPITGAHVFLFAANAGVFTPNTNGYGNASASLLTSGTLDNSTGPTHNDYYVTTDPSGNFSISGDYSCTSGQQVYLYAVDGNPGLTSGTNNTAAGLMAVLGNCPGGTSAFASGTPFVLMNEVSTIAAAYAFAGFATDALHVSSSGTPLAKTGIANAFANAANLETLSTGVALSGVNYTNGTVSVPQSEINTLADILAACVNTDGTVSGPASPTPCYTLFTNALSGGTTGSQPTDTATAAINIAHNPGSNVGALFGLAASNPPFVGLSSQPNDFTIDLSVTGGGIVDTVGIAIDDTGNVWAADRSNSSVTELSSLGAPLSGPTGYSGGSINQPFGIAIDNNVPGNIWVTNFGGNGVTELNSSGTASAGSPYTAGSINQPAGIAIDGTGDIWIANNGNSTVTELLSSGAAHAGTPYSGGGLNAPISIAIDTSGNAWAANGSGSSVTELTGSGGVHSGAPYSGGGVSNSEGIAFDSSGNAWISNLGAATSSVTELSSSGTASGGSPYSGGGLSAGGSGLIAIDGAGNVWVANISGGGSANANGGSVSELSNSGAAISGANGYTGVDQSGTSSFLDNPAGVAVNLSGNVWVSCLDNVVELVGAATPVVTPLSTAVATSNLGTRP